MEGVGGMITTLDFNWPWKRSVTTERLRSKCRSHDSAATTSSGLPLLSTAVVAGFFTTFDTSYMILCLVGILGKGTETNERAGERASSFITL
jgi:hypothetical protein